MIKSCYVHIPFCKSICSYCDFCKNFYNENIVNNYLAALNQEINDVYQNEILNTLYVGGGTPSSLSMDKLNKLFEILKKFNLSENYELTFECNYEDINEELLIFLRNNRVNRLSIGIESFNNKFQNILSRKINKEEMLVKIKLAKNYFDSINVDLMYDLPTQTLEDLKDDIEIFKSLNVTHISTYSLIIEDHTNLKINNNVQFDEDLSLMMYDMIKKELKESGYVQYELSNFSKEGYYSKHNITYWNNDEYYGFGAGASGFIGKIRYDNTRSLFNYINKNKRMYEEKVDKKKMMMDEVMLNLRKIDGINIDYFYEKYKVKFQDAFDYTKMVDEKLLVVKNNNIFIPDDKLFVSNEIIIRLFDCYILND